MRNAGEADRNVGLGTGHVLTEEVDVPQRSVLGGNEHDHHLAKGHNVHGIPQKVVLGLSEQRRVELIYAS